MERRRSTRIRTRMRCDVELNGKWLRAIVLDISDGGLALRVESEAEQGTNLRLRITPPGRDQIEVRALIWHTRPVTAASGDRVHVCGMVLADESEDWSSWVRDSLEASMQSTTPDLPAPKRPTASKPEKSASPVEADLASYRIRLKARSGPRTRTLSLSAMNETEARRLASEQFGKDWDLLEVYAA